MLARPSSVLIQSKEIWVIWTPHRMSHQTITSFFFFKKKHGWNARDLDWKHVSQRACEKNPTKISRWATSKTLTENMCPKRACTNTTKFSRWATSVTLLRIAWEWTWSRNKFASHEERGTEQSLQLILVVFSSGFEGCVSGVTIVAEMGSRYRPTAEIFT